MKENSIKIYKNGKWIKMTDTAIYQNGEWLQLEPHHRLFFEHEYEIVNRSLDIFVEDGGSSSSSSSNSIPNSSSSSNSIPNSSSSSNSIPNSSSEDSDHSNEGDVVFKYPKKINVEEYDLVENWDADSLGYETREKYWEKVLEYEALPNEDSTENSKTVRCYKTNQEYDPWNYEITLFFDEKTGEITRWEPTDKNLVTKLPDAESTQHPASAYLMEFIYENKNSESPNAYYNNLSEELK